MSASVKPAQPSVLLGLTSRFFVLVVACVLPVAVMLLVLSHWSTLALASVAISLALAAAGSWFAAGRLDRWLAQFARASERLAHGDLEVQVYPPRIAQLAGVATSFNAMAAQLKQRVAALTQLSGEQEAILRSMAEGVVTVDHEQRIQRVNASARRLLDISTTRCEGRLVAEVIHHAEVQRIIGAAHQQHRPGYARAVIPGYPERIVQLYATPLEGEQQGTLGTLLVLQDITRIERLEQVRRDFIANVSHEVKTPITSIRGFTETLRDGAKDDPAALDRFLGIISQQAQRLEAIFNDLLTLARLEAQDDDARVSVSLTKATELVQGAVSTCSYKLEQRGATLVVDLAPELQVRVNATLFEQALVNLIDNAVTYCERQPHIVVRAAVEGTQVCFSVTDNGPGIAPAHLPRLFERFYRVDAGRSRSRGGTGLGLSIVKHVAHVHGGTVNVESTPGKGSVFSVYLPETSAPSPRPQSQAGL
jgi:two-component system phosphate regulon sensor histidine kinase PhoR